MALRMDPKKNELRALQQATDWRGAQVLELGCGNGRLTRRLATLGVEKIHALDTDTDLVRAARQELPKRYAPRITYRVGSAERLKYPANSFDIVLFSWAL